MARTKARSRSRKGSTKKHGSSFLTLRRRAQTMMTQLRRAGMRQVQGLERQIEHLNQQRHALMKEIGVAIGGISPARGRGGAAVRSGGRRRTDWEAVFTNLPKTSFRAGDVRALVPNVAGGTLSLQLTRWVKEKKLRRTGTRRGTRYTRSA